MGLARLCSALRNPSDAASVSANCQLVLATLLLSLSWMLDAALDASFFPDRTFYQGLVTPLPHELAGRSLVLLLTGCFLAYSSRVAKVRASLEQALQDADRERAKVVAVVEAMGDAISSHDAQFTELDQANRDLKAFSHAISHDLRTPLTRIYSSGQALKEYAPLLDANGLFFVKAINDGCVQIEALLDALLALSRVTDSALACEPVDLSRLAHEKVAELRRLEPERRVSVRIAPQLVTQGDPKLLSIALENLLGNAWKYSAQVEEARIELGSLVTEQGETVFFVRDNGSGFDDTLADQLFKPFRRLHSPQQFAGTGLGLATVGRIIRRHNGRVWGEGKPGGGATFYFTVNG